MNICICPLCHRLDGVPVLWGFPTNRDLELANRGNIILGGCEVDDPNINRQCRNCRHQWNSFSAVVSKTPSQPVIFETQKPKPARARAKAKPPGKIRRLNTSRKKTVAPVTTTTLSQNSELKSVSIIPTLIVFALVLLGSFTIVGSTVCADGWTGSTGGRGACSHHGGVNGFPQLLAFLFSVFIALGFHFYRMERAFKQ